MKSEVKTIKEGELLLSVSLDKNELLKYVEQAEDLLAKDLKVDGFRKGKVPKDLARKQLGQELIRSTALDLAVEGSLDNVLKEKGLEVLKAEKLNIEKNDENELTYAVTLMIFPEIELPDIKTIKISKKEPEVSEKDVQDAIEAIRTARAVYKPKDGQVESGDKVEVDFEVMADGKIVEGGVSKSHPVVIGNNNFIPGFEDNLVGMKKGESKKFSLKAPSDYFNKDLAGKELSFSVVVQDVKEVIKPELNDDFVKTLGKFTSLTDLMTSLKEGIRQEKEISERQKRRVEILAKIAEGTKVKVPDHITEDRLESMINSFDRDLHQKGLELGLYLAHLKKTREDLQKEWRADAERQAKYGLIIKKIATENKIDVSAEELEEVTKRRLEALLMSGQVDKDSIDAIKLRGLVMDELVNERTLLFIEKNCIA